MTRTKIESDVEPLSRDEALAMRGTGWAGDLEQLRGGYLQEPPAPTPS